MTIGRIVVSRRALLRGSLAAALPLPALGRRRAAAQAAGPVAVFPRPGCRSVSPGTEISFRGLSVDQLGAVQATGSRSGLHSGLLLPHGDGRGASFLPDAPFWANETVTIETELTIRGGTNGAFTYRTATPVSWATRTETNQEAGPEQVHGFRSRPDLTPPRIEVLTNAAGTAPGLLFLGPKRGFGPNGALIIDAGGEPVWFHPVAAEREQIYDLRVQTYRGEPVLTWWQGYATEGQGRGHWEIRNAAYEPVAAVRAGNGYPGADSHEFTLTPRGTALVNVYSTIRWDTSAAGGQIGGSVVDAIVQEIEIATGRVLFEWHSLDDVGLDESYDAPSADDPEAAYDYFHVNSATEAPDGNLIVNARNTWAVYKLDRATGELRWRLGGKRSDFAMGEDAQPAYQHDARLWPGGELTLFDNADYHDEASRSRGLTLLLDEKAMTATVVREYVHPENLRCRTQGNMQRLPNGNVFVGWGNEPWLSEFAADGTLLFDARIGASKHSYRAYRFPWAGAPAAAPDLAAERRSGGHVTLSASWNGATEVAAWQALVGESADTLLPVGDPVPRAGFEIELTIETDATVVAVEALDARGNALGRSAALPPSSRAQRGTLYPPQGVRP